MDVIESEVEPGGRSGRRWQMADEVLYVPQNIVAQHVTADGERLSLLSARIGFSNS